MPKKTCPRCKKRVRENAARCRHCGYSFPEKMSPWPAGPALGVGFPLVLIGVMTMFIIGLSPTMVIAAGVIAMVGVLFFFNPR